MLEDNDKPWHCGVCGAPHAWGLCRACIEQWAPDGVIPPWMSFLRTSVNKAKQRAIRQARMADEGILFGDQICRVEFMSLESFLDRGGQVMAGERPARKRGESHDA